MCGNKAANIVHANCLGAIVRIMTLRDGAVATNHSDAPDHEELCTSKSVDKEVHGKADCDKTYDAVHPGRNKTSVRALEANGLEYSR